MVIVLLAMGYYLYKQQQTITDLKTSLDTEMQSNQQLQKQLDDLKKAPPAPPLQQIPTALSQTPPAATPTPAASNWMWSKSALDAPANKH